MVAAVRATRGMRAVSGMPLSLVATSCPETSPRLTSTRIRSGRFFCADEMPDSPSAASSTRYPSLSRMRLTSSRLPGSSSIYRTLFLLSSASIPSVQILRVPACPRTLCAGVPQSVLYQGIDQVVQHIEIGERAFLQQGIRLPGQPLALERRQLLSRDDDDRNLS